MHSLLLSIILPLNKVSVQILLVVK
jgi:hypothetical protein